MGKLSKFDKIWEGDTGPTFYEKVKNAFKPKEPLKYKLALAQYKLRSTISRLEVFINRLQERDKLLFERVIDAYMAKDHARATMYANEVAEIRKLVKMLLRTQVALEQVSLRLETIREIGEVVVSLGPILGVVHELRRVVKGLMPEVSIELAEVEEILQSVVIEAGELTGTGVGFVPTSPDAKKILEEAAIIAEQRMKEKFPELPTVEKLVGEEAKAESGT